MVQENNEEKTTMLPRSRYKFSWPVLIISLTLLASVPANALPNAVAVLPFIDGRTDSPLWSEEFNRDPVDLSAAQAEIAERIAMAMQVQLLPDERSRIESRLTDSTEAYQQYLRARSLPAPLISPEYLPAYIDLLERVVAIDPNNASFHGRLGYILLNAGDLPAAATHLREAIRLDSSVYMNYFELATAGYLSDDRSAARESLNHAVRVMESGATFRVGYLAYLYGLLDEPEQAAELLAQYEESLGDPEGEKWRPLGWALLGTGDRERALRDWTRTVDGYLEENQPVSRGRISRFRENWLNDPMLEQAEFLQLRRRLGFRE